MHKTTKNHRREEMSLFDEESRFAMVNLLPSSFGQQLRHAYESEHASLFVLDERSLVRELKRLGFYPGTRDYILRLQFWQEYEAALHTPRNQNPVIHVSKVTKNTISKENFYKHYITDPLKVIWLLCPPSEIQNAVRVLTMDTIDSLRSFVIQAEPPKGMTKINYAKQLAAILNQLMNHVRYFDSGGKMGQGNRGRVKPIEAPPPEVDPLAKLAELSSEDEKSGA